MPDIYIDFDALRRTRTAVADMEGLLHGPCRAMRSLPAEAAGDRALVDRLREFGDQWDYGIRKLGEFSAACVEALTGVEEAFTRLDADLASALETASENGS